VPALYSIRNDHRAAHSCVVVLDTHTATAHHDNKLILQDDLFRNRDRISNVGAVRRRTEPAGGPTCPHSSVGPFGRPVTYPVGSSP
jgi:hypothetical protein